MDNLAGLAILAFIISLVATPLIKKLAFKVNAVDIPKDNRRVHKKPIPLLGGVAIYLGFIITVILKKGPLSASEFGIISGATVILMGGILDDIKELKPWQKIIFQLIATLCLLLKGVRIDIITNPLSDKFVSISYLSIPFTIIWIVGITNAINLIDGLDGLAAGVALISALTLLLIAILKGRIEAAYLTAVLSGAILGFLPYNFNPASIFMGDAGAQLLGFLLSSISIEGAIKSAAAFAIVVPILAMGLPIFDTIFAMIRRKINGKPIMQGDRGHLHHRLLDLGLNQKQAVVVMYLMSAVLGGISIIAMQISSVNSYFLLTLVILLIAVITWKCGFFKNRE